MSQAWVGSLELHNFVISEINYTEQCITNHLVFFIVFCIVPSPSIMKFKQTMFIIIVF